MMVRSRAPALAGSTNSRGAGARQWLEAQADGGARSSAAAGPARWEAVDPITASASDALDRCECDVGTGLSSCVDAVRTSGHDCCTIPAKPDMLCTHYMTCIDLPMSVRTRSHVIAGLQGLRRSDQPTTMIWNMIAAG